MDVQAHEPEAGLFILWPRARARQDDILADLSGRFEIRGVHEIAWSAAATPRNFMRFYRERPEPPYRGAFFLQQKGQGPFLLVVVKDHAPRYEQRRTPRGMAEVNARLFDAKARYREWFGGAMCVHATDTGREANRDLVLLLGIDANAYLQAHQARWDGHVDARERDLSGAHGWDCMADALAALNASVNYIVLRNFERLPGEHRLGYHDDVDLLTDSYHELVRVLNARPLLGRLPRWGGRFTVRVAGEEVIFDLRHVGDRYYPHAWARRLLARRVFHDNGFFVPDGEDYADSLLYHAAVHKKSIKPDYRARLAALAAGLGRQGWEQAALGEREHVRGLLQDTLRAHGVSYVKPRDPTVFYNFDFVGHRMPWLRRKLAGLHRRLYVFGSVRLGWLTPLYWRTRRAVVSLVPWLRDLRAWALARETGHG